MKKFVSIILSLSLCAVSLFGLASCGGDNQPSENGSGKVKLVPIANPADISAALGYDYYLAAEPLASLKVKATANTEKPLYLVADLQKLYGGENGYPQAVLVAKNSFVEENKGWVEAFMNDMSAAAEWLTAETTEISTIVNAVSSHLTEGMTPSLQEGNLTRSVIENCGVWFTGAQAGKAEVNAFLQEMIGVSESSVKTVADKFFYSVSGSNVTTEPTAKIYMPDGAPALSMAKFMSENKAGCEFNVVDAGTIATYVTGANPIADLCVLPLNAASKLLGTGEKYVMLGTVTHGNLYLLSENNEVKFEKGSDLTALVGKTIGTIQINNVPGLTLKLILKKNNVEYAEQGTGN